MAVLRPPGQLPGQERVRYSGGDGAVRRVEEMAGNSQAEVGPGDVFEIATPGGGGYGAPA
ncbi:MAG: hydantoinase B/oxoprolinase family protein [bacterium]|nr:hydantoinase B/oxoprolinase family protein [bacterium]